MRVREILGDRAGNVITVSPDDGMREAATTMVENVISALLVKTKDGDLVGILTERDIARHFSQSGSVTESLVSGSMSGNIISCSLHDEVAEVINIMMDQNIRHLPILDSGKAVGILSVRDLVRDHVAALENENHVLRELISTLE